MEAFVGFALAIIAGGMVGSFSLPMKKTVKWAWENTWLVWAFVALIVVPWTVVLVTVPDIQSVYRSAGLKALGTVFLFGVGWGLGAVTFGQGIALIGMSLAFAISIGLTTALGSFVPMAADPKVFSTSGGITVTIGIVVMIVGVIICAVAGGMKESRSKATVKDGSAEQSVVPVGLFLKGLILCVLSGIFNPMINFAFNFSGGIKEAALSTGATAGGASDAVWAFTLLGGFAANAIYCMVLLTRKRTWSGYSKAGTGNYWLLAAIMGATWMLSVTVYGRAAALMGPLGGSAGWAIYMGFCIVVSSVWGILTGEWREGKGRPIRTMVAGLAVLVAAIIIIGIGNALPK
ncbi:MAG: hypothetical protein HYX78_04215 [Armatimonadetes bacterium]|nr:hypothetical protein [Armatimonadota bacterium]